MTTTPPSHLAAPPSADPLDLLELPQERLMEWLEAMILIRSFESALDPLSLSGKIPGGVHLAIGQEAVAVGASRALADSDIITTSHRPHHHALAKGLSPDTVMAELFGKATGCSGGRGGTMHLTDFDRGYLPGNAVVGANLGIATGAALAAKVLDRPQVACAFFGDGAANTGRTWEAVNMAVIWGLPLIAVCENNLYAVETFIENVTGGESIAARAAGFGIHAEQVDGQNIVSVYEAVSRARERAASDEAPTFIEALTYRFEGHSTGEVVNYRTEEEASQWKAQADPIERLRTALTRDGRLTDRAFAAMLERGAEVVSEAVRFADDSPSPGLEASTEHVNSINWIPESGV